MDRDRAQSLYEWCFTLSFCLLPALCMLPKIAGVLPAFAGALLFLSYYLVYRKDPPVTKSIIAWIVALVILAGLSSLWAVNPSALRSAAGIGGVLIPAGLYIGLSFAAPAGVIDRVSRLFPVFYAVGVLLLVIDIYGGMPLYRMLHHVKVDRTSIPTDWDNRPATYFVLFFIPAAILAYFPVELSTVQRRVRLAIVTIPMMFVLGGTAAQSAQLAFVLEMLFLALFPYRFRLAGYALAAVFAVVILGAPWLMMAAFKYLPALLAGHEWFGRAYANNRLEIWDYVSRYALKHPLYGFGVEATRVTTDFGTKQIYQKTSTILHPHNFVIQAWVEFGLLGASLVAGMMTHLLLSLFRLEVRRQRAALPVLIGCLLFMSVSYGIWQAWFLGLLSAVMALTAIAMAAIKPVAEA
ncbi:MAG TPA: O-antigen ligase family protein [Patescibacteria group bacterium]|nr:O-antigen ligase family protein [Patescibacteria group bacterium]